MSLTLPWTISNYPSAIFHEIVLHTDSDPSTLKALCLTASPFKDMAQKVLFSTTKIRGLDHNPDELKTQTERINTLYEIINSREELGLLVKSLEFDFGPSTLPTPEAAGQAAFLLSKFQQVEQVVLSLHPVDSTSLNLHPAIAPNASPNSESPLFSAILKLLQRPSLVRATFDNFNQLSPAHILHLGPSVRDLGFINQTFFPYEEIEGFDMSAQDILEGYHLNPHKEPPQNKVYIESLDLDVFSSAMLCLLDRMMDSPFCALNLSRVKRFTCRSERSLQQYMDALGLIYERVKGSLTTLDTFNGHGFLIPPMVKLQEFTGLQSFKVFLGLHDEGKPELDSFLSFLEDGVSTSYCSLSMRFVTLTIMIRYETFVEDIEKPVWGRMSEIFSGRSTPEDVQKMRVTWILGYRNAMRLLDDEELILRLTKLSAKLVKYDEYIQVRGKYYVSYPSTIPESVRGARRMPNNSSGMSRWHYAAFTDSSRPTTMHKLSLVCSFAAIIYTAIMSLNGSPLLRIQRAGHLEKMGQMIDDWERLR
ncbi:hypothetical protein BJ165DRAFT_1407991 [Panaeolus papilionaceus]|nr:hypothetical protein BJ165DRAFT_1407991 [Panaeolus papilionaceus]